MKKKFSELKSVFQIAEELEVSCTDVIRKILSGGYKTFAINEIEHDAGTGVLLRTLPRKFIEFCSTLEDGKKLSKSEAIKHGMDLIYLPTEYADDLFPVVKSSNCDLTNSTENSSYTTLKTINLADPVTPSQLRILNAFNEFWKDQSSEQRSQYLHRTGRYKGEIHTTRLSEAFCLPENEKYLSHDPSDVVPDKNRIRTILSKIKHLLRK